MMDFKQTQAENVLELSLDEYIKKSDIYVSPMLKQPRIKNFTNEESKFKKKNYLRNGANKFTEPDEQMEEDDDILDITPGETALEFNSDLRDKLNKYVPNDDLPKAKSASWRLMQPNVAENRPAGIPPLIPAELFNNAFDIYKVNDRNNIPNQNFQAKPELSPQNNSSFYNNKRYQNRRNNYNNSSNNYSRNHSPYNNNYNRNFIRNHQNNRHLDGFANNMCRVVGTNFPQNLNVQPNLQSGNISTLTKNFENMEPTILKPQQPPLIYDPSPQEIAVKNGLNILNSCSGSNTSLLAIPQIASKLLEIIGVAPKPEPKYDMKIQREIHALQNKPMIYRCPDGEVISSDGRGIGGVPLKPNSTGITLNQRFA